MAEVKTVRARISCLQRVRDEEDMSWNLESARVRCIFAAILLGLMLDAIANGEVKPSDLALTQFRR